MSDEPDPPEYECRVCMGSGEVWNPWPDSQWTQDCPLCKGEGTLKEDKDE